MPPSTGRRTADDDRHRTRRRGRPAADAVAAWLRVHALFLTGVRNRVKTFPDWGFDYFSRSRGPQVLDRLAAADIDSSDDPTTVAGPTLGPSVR
jgi:hypothetical protein